MGTKSLMLHAVIRELMNYKSSSGPEKKTQIVKIVLKYL